MIYDGQNHVIQTVSPLNEPTSFIYDGNQNMTNAVDALDSPTNMFTTA